MLSKLARYLLRNNENFKKLDEMLSKPEDWRCNDVCLYHKTEKLSLWIYGGMSSFRINKPKEIKFVFLMKRALWCKAKKLIVKKDKLTELLKSIKQKEDLCN
ncbi:hypothetical protein [Actinobacillus porcinus]|uniref:hypothetical protein n=1 Tax=Actinobacillus porcinus TaxID=51048 RepID=UPI0023F01D1E|nr:hypothetical protein [Actinobacillus porcinus]MDD7545354.1 hypothetical protein [Actinobacillus porcinus]MDY5848728.1 hypothetical protein [Actinobacillus porcinus]